MTTLGRFSRDNRNRVIGDAKYKPAENIGNKDYLQVLAYMLRFDAKKGFYFYPECTQVAEEHILWVNSGTTYEKNVKRREDMCVIKHGLHIPDHSISYKDFSDQMSLAETKFRVELIQHMSTTKAF